MAGTGEFLELLGKSLQRKRGDDFIEVETDKSEGLGEKKFVGLYFSASWCPPCNAFTPQLMGFYNKMKEAGADKFEVVLVSSDKDEESFKSYVKSYKMPWLLLPFSDRNKKNKLSKTFKVAGIPTLVILDGQTGKEITNQGRENVQGDPEGGLFPWFQKDTKQIFEGEAVSSQDREKFKQGDFPGNLKGQVVGMYFSAYRCPTSRTFTPQLAKKYKELRDAGKPFQIVFASMDSNEEDYNDYFKTMPWLALPFEDSRIRSFLNLFRITGSPALVILNEDLEVITTEGRSAIMDSPMDDFPYKIQMVNKISNRFIDILTNSKCLIYFTDSEEDEKRSKEVMMGPSKEYYNDGKDQEFYFFEGNTSDKLCGSHYDHLMKAEKRRCLVISDLENSTKYEYKAADNWTVSEDSIREFISQFKDNKIEATYL